MFCIIIDEIVDSQDYRCSLRINIFQFLQLFIDRSRSDHHHRPTLQNHQTTKLLLPFADIRNTILNGKRHSLSQFFLPQWIVV